MVAWHSGRVLRRFIPALLLAATVAALPLAAWAATTSSGSASGNVRGATRSTLPMLVTVSPAGTRIAWSDGFDWRVWVANKDGSGQHAASAPFSDGIGQLTWTRFGLIADSNYTLTLLTQSGRRIKIGGVGDEHFSVGGAHVASGRIGCGGCHGPISVFNIRTHTVVHLGNPKDINANPALSPDGARVAYDIPRGVVIQAAKGGRARLIQGGSCLISWSPDGKTLAFGSTGIATQPATGGHLATLVPPSRGAACVDQVPAWSPDSREIAFVRSSGGRGSSQPLVQLAVLDLHMHAMRLTAKQLGSVTSYAWSPDGASIFATFRTDDCGTIWRLDAASLTGNAIYQGCS
jgi:WD40 repeat protein